MMEKNKSLKIIVFSVIFLILVAFAVRLRSNEDNWICSSGKWVRHGNPAKPAPLNGCGQNLAQDSNQMPVRVVNNFYDWYLGYKGNASLEQTGYLSSNLKTKLTSISKSGNTVGDPILCIENKPKTIKVSAVTVIRNGNSAMVLLNNTVDGQKTNNYQVELIKDEGGWLMDDVVCEGDNKTVKSTTEKNAAIYFANSKKAPKNSDCGTVFATGRLVKTQDYHKSLLQELFKGPTSQEKADGYNSIFSDKTKNILKSVKVENGTAYVNLIDIRKIIPNVSASCGSKEFFTEVEKTLNQDGQVGNVIYAINGDPEIFYEWVQIGCTPENNNCDKKNFQ